MAAISGQFTANGQVSETKSIKGNYTIAINGIDGSKIYLEYRFLDNPEVFRSKVIDSNNVWDGVETKAGVKISLNCVDMGASSAVNFHIQTQDDTK